MREARELIRHRIQLVWLRGIVRNRLQALLDRRNLHPTRWSNKQSGEDGNGIEVEITKWECVSWLDARVGRFRPLWARVRPLF